MTRAHSKTYSLVRKLNLIKQQDNIHSDVAIRIYAD